MDDQLDIPGIVLEPVEYGEDDSTLDRFLAFHAANPHVLTALIELCSDVRRRGRRRWSINGAFEVLRWSSLRTTGADFKLNNNYRSLYARFIPLVEPALGDVDGVSFFATRTVADSLIGAALERAASNVKDPLPW